MISHFIAYKKLQKKVQKNNKLYPRRLKFYGIGFELPEVWNSDCLNTYVQTYFPTPQFSHALFAPGMYPANLWLKFFAKIVK